MGCKPLEKGVADVDRSRSQLRCGEQHRSGCRCFGVDGSSGRTVITVGIWELMVRTRRHWARDKQKHLGRDLLDMSRIGLLYGLLLEGFKLL